MLTYWNSKRIAAELERRYIYKVGHTHIDQLLHDRGCSRGSISPVPGERYERTHPNELWHVDIKGPFFIQLASRSYLKTWLFGLVDDHSRFLIGLQIHDDATAAPVLQWLEDCFELCGQPLQLMSDNGMPFVVWMPGVLTRFGKRLRDLNIRHLRTQISTPWTNGKIEPSGRCSRAKSSTDTGSRAWLRLRALCASSPTTTTSIVSAALLAGAPQPSATSAFHSPTAALSTSLPSNTSNLGWRR